ncbi:hypothetical protein BJY01DRAFT_245827 [Aspergillus pseudoustus]|uniref:Uncharacterized protein n=1 Tax=Aspergillus pseudoustus TaxID=1810923 RepID=A0ABR4KB81_9EURO
MGPSLLDYARFHGIANSYLAIDPLGHVTHLGRDTLPEAVLSKYNDRLSDARAAVEETLRQEKLHIPERAGRLLASVICEAQTERAMVDWDDILPDFYRFGDMKLELPIFPMEDDSKSLHYASHDIELQLSQNPYKAADPNPDAAHPLSRLHANRIPLLEQIRKEKLVCSRGSISFMQNARDGGETPIKELLGELDGLLGINCVSL